jgi:hypothetical protein
MIFMKCILLRILQLFYNVFVSSNATQEVCTLKFIYLFTICNSEEHLINNVIHLMMTEIMIETCSDSK